MFSFVAVWMARRQGIESLGTGPGEPWKYPLRLPSWVRGTVLVSSVGFAGPLSGCQPPVRLNDDAINLNLLVKNRLDSLKDAVMCTDAGKISYFPKY